jgi:hypothetical protein
MINILPKVIDLVDISECVVNVKNLTWGPARVHIAPPSGMFKEDSVAFLAKKLSEDLPFWDILSPECSLGT